MVFQMGKLENLLKYVGVTIAAAVFPPSASVFLYLATKRCRDKGKRESKNKHMRDIIKSVLDLRPGKLRVLGKIGRIRVYDAGRGIYILHSGYTLQGWCKLRVRVKDSSRLSDIVATLSTLPGVALGIDAETKAVYIRITASRHALRPSKHVAEAVLKEIQIRLAQTLSILRLLDIDVQEKNVIEEPLGVFSA